MDNTLWLKGRCETSDFIPQTANQYTSLKKIFKDRFTIQTVASAKNLRSVANAIGVCLGQPEVIVGVG